MGRIIKSVLVVSLIFLFQGGFTQSEMIDSLKARLPHTLGSDRVQTLITLSEEYRGYLFDDCISCGKQAAQLAERGENIDLQALAFKSIGVSYFFEGDLEISLNYYEKSLNLYVENNNLKGMANCLNNIGLVYLERGNYTKAKDYYQKKYEIVKSLGNYQSMASALIQLGNINYYRSNYQQSLDYYYQAMLIYNDIDDKSGKADASYSLGIIYSEMKSFAKALEYYKKAETTYSETGNNRDLSHVLNNMAKIYNFEFKDFNTAYLLYEQSLELKKQLNDKIGIALLYNNLGTLFGNKKDYNEAMIYFGKSKTLYEEIGSESGLMMVVFNIGEVYMEKGEIQHAIMLYKESLEMAKKNGEVSYINQNYEALFYSHAQLCKYDEFDKYYKLFAIGKDTLIDRLNQAEIAEVEAKYKVEGLLRELSNMQKDNDRQTEEIRNNKLLLAGIAGLFLLFLFYIVFRKWRS